jgi:hypothetical protein
MRTTHRITVAIAATVLSLTACAVKSDQGTTTDVTATDEGLEDCSGPGPALETLDAEVLDRLGLGDLSEEELADLDRDDLARLGVDDDDLRAVGIDVGPSEQEDPSESDSGPAADQPDSDDVADPDDGPVANGANGTSGPFDHMPCG